MSSKVLRGNLVQWIEEGRPFVPIQSEVATSPLRCPSYSDLGSPLAVRLRNGSFVFAAADQLTTINLDTVSTRTHGPCVKTRCHYWEESCQLGAKIAEISELCELTATVDTSKCPIRATCRWFAENGQSACIGCTHADYQMR